MGLVYVFSGRDGLTTLSPKPSGTRMRRRNTSSSHWSFIVILVIWGKRKEALETASTQNGIKR
jgi:hypothetical protein